VRLPPILSNRKFIFPAAILACIGLAFLLIMATNILGDEMIFTLGSVLNAPLAIVITILAASIHRRMGIQKHPRGMWAGLVICWALWAVAESLWFIFSLTGNEPPYPSWADLFWLLGYIPLVIGLVSRLRSIPNKPTLFQEIVIWLISLLIILAAGIFVIKPTIAYWGEGRLAENLPNILYPVADLIVAIIILRLFFSFEKGDYGFGWRLIAVGFFLLTIADLVFTYATWEDLYYPNMEANLVSRLFVDAPYTLSYLFWLLGIMALNILFRQEKPPQKTIAPIHVPRYCHILLSTAADDSIIQYSKNLEQLIDTSALMGRELGSALPIGDKDARLLLAGLHGNDKVTDLPVLFLHSSGKLLGLKICGMAVKDTSGKYLGSNIVMRVPVTDAAADACLSEENKGKVDYILKSCGSDFPAEVGRFLLEYHLVYLDELFRLAEKEGGATMTNSIVDKMKEICARNNWQLQCNPQTGITRAEYPLETLRAALPVLLQAVSEFITQVEDQNTVQQKILEVHDQINQVVHDEAARLLRLGAVVNG